MKKIFLSLAFAAAGLSLASCNGDREKNEAAFAQKCMEGGGNAVSDPKMKEYFNEYCKCSAEKVFDKYSQKEVEGMEADAKKSGNSEAMLAKLMPIIKPCMDDLQKKATAAAPAQ